MSYIVNICLFFTSIHYKKLNNNDNNDNNSITYKHNLRWSTV